MNDTEFMCLLLKDQGNEIKWDFEEYELKLSELNGF